MQKKFTRPLWLAANLAVQSVNGLPSLRSLSADAVGGSHHPAPILTHGRPRGKPGHRATRSCHFMRFECTGVTTLFFFEQRAVQDHGVAPLFRTCPGTKEATSKTCRHGPQRQSRAPPTKGVPVACALVSCDACVLVSVQVPAARPT
jgi:hypothetical protein